MRMLTRLISPVCLAYRYRHPLSPRMNKCRRQCISQLIQVPAIFTGLLLVLWTWKSLTLIVFQNKIIYMPYLGRHEQLQQYPTSGARWHRHTLTTSDGKRLALCRSELIVPTKPVKPVHDPKQRMKRVTIVYLQGNASSTPPRLPRLSKLLLSAQTSLPNIQVCVWTVSYRGYWESTGSPSEAGLCRDVRESLSHIIHTLKLEAENTAGEEEDTVDEILIWGHSIGAFLATQSLHHLISQLDRTSPRIRIKVLLETPFDSIKSILLALYPERWLPYRYLSPFLRTRMDMPRVLSSLSLDKSLVASLQDLPVLIIVAGKDEIVPVTVSRAVTSTFRREKVGLVEVKVINGALHQDCLFKPEMHRFVMDFIKK